MALSFLVNTYLVDAEPFLAGEPEWLVASDEGKEQSLVSATRLLDSNLWAGSASTSTQSLAWPRTKMSYYDPVFNLNVTVEEGDVPVRLAKATARLALHLLRYPQVERGYEATFDSITVGPISLTNANASSDPGPVPTVPREVKSLIEPLVVSYTMGQWWRAN